MFGSRIHSCFVRPTAIVALALLLLAGCGGSGPEGAFTARAQAAQPPAAGRAPANQAHPFPQKVAIPEFSKLVPESVSDQLTDFESAISRGKVADGAQALKVLALLAAALKREETGSTETVQSLLNQLRSALAPATVGDGTTARTVFAQLKSALLDLTWLNSKPLTKADLKGKFVLLDFWTYCCINCMHILPELKKLEAAYPNNLVVIGVHSAKFETEKVTENIREAILRYEIAHPVINDADHDMWRSYSVSSWPTIVLIDPEGMFVGRNPGEFKAELVSGVLNNALPYYRAKGLLDENPLKFDLESAKEDKTPLRFPGKILADEAGGRLFISDSNHNRLVITSLDGQLQATIGTGEIGRSDGDYQSATFNHPQGCALLGETLYVADTENHLLRKVDLTAKTVTTIAGTGEQGTFYDAFPGWNGESGPAARKRWLGQPAATPLNSPWALWIHKTDLYIAMAGYHQIWKMPLSEQEIGPFAGNGHEDILDGPKMPVTPRQRGSAFAQPSGLSSDGTWLFVADSEGSSVRAVPFEGATREVKTVLGTSGLSEARLFTFGDRDGPKGTARLQHCLEVVYLNGKIYVADTYNHKVKVVDAKSGEAKTVAGTGKPGTPDEPAQFHEPAGLAVAKGKLYVADTNNHLLRTIDLATGKVATLTIAGLTAPGTAAEAANQ